MKSALTFAGLLLTAILQTSVAPLFPFSLAQADFALLFVAWIMFFRGPHTSMWVVPTLAVLLGFMTNHSPALFLLGFMPVVILASVLRVDGTNLLLGKYWRAAGIVVATGTWTRSLFALIAIVQGADPSIGVLIGSIIIPGIFLDWALLTLAFVPSRLIGLDVANTALSRGGYTAYERS